MRKYYHKFLSLLLATVLLTGCNNDSNQPVGTTGTTGAAATISETVSNISQKDEKITIVTTTFPEYDWVREILGDSISNVNLVQLMDNGVDLHSYSPSVSDMLLIGNADLFIHNGGESVDVWVDDVLNQTASNDIVVLNLLNELGNNSLEAPHFHYDENGEVCTDEDCDHDHDHDHDEECTDENCDHDHSADEHAHDEECTDEDCDHDHSEDEHEHEHEEDCVEECCLEDAEPNLGGADHDHDHAEDEDDHDHDHDEECTDEDCDHDHDHDHDEECTDENCDHDHSSSHDDEHFWMSLKNAQTLSSLITQELCTIDPANASVYNDNLVAYLEKLDALDKEYETMISEAQRNVILVGDRFPYVYLTNDYNLEYYAAFSGCTAETEASFETIVFLAQKLDELNLTSVITTETGNDIANSIINSSSSKDQEVFVIDSMQATTSTSGDTYLSVMEENLKVLTKVLN